MSESFDPLQQAVSVVDNLLQSSLISQQRTASSATFEGGEVRCGVENGPVQNETAPGAYFSGTSFPSNGWIQPCRYTCWVGSGRTDATFATTPPLNHPGCAGIGQGASFRSVLVRTYLAASGVSLTFGKSCIAHRRLQRAPPVPFQIPWSYRRSLPVAPSPACLP